MNVSRITVAAVLFAAIWLSVGAFAAAGERKARVAGGQEVTLADSKYSDARLAKMRPNFRALIPTVH